MSDEFEADKDARDLLGDPVDQRHELIGRPGFKITKENQELVSVLKGAGWPNERIARHLGIDVKTLRKHFSHELMAAADMLEAEALVAIVRRMRDGNVSAARQVIGMSEKGRAAPPEKKAAAEVETKSEADPMAGLGKKERQAEAAKRPTGGWGGLLPH